MISAVHLRKPETRFNSGMYYIQDKQGHTVKYIPNFAQRQFLAEYHWRDIILKARQLGFSTCIDLMLLDLALFRPGTRVGIVADTEDTAKELLQTKIRFPYFHLPPELQSAINLTSDNVFGMEFTNGSAVHVGVTLRSGSYFAVHVSEFGKICSEHPDKAEEIISGTIETVPTDGMVIIESTARGRTGKFFEWWQRWSSQPPDKELSDLEYKPHFYPWYTNPDYVLDGNDPVPERIIAKFDGLGVQLSLAQLRWYAAKELSLGDSMDREYPSCPEDAFRESLEGCYFAREMSACRREGRIAVVPVDPALPVNTYWDLGMDDSMAIVFAQSHGRERRIVDYHEGSGEGLPHYARVLQDRGYNYGTHYAPHDIAVRELSGKSRLETAASVGVRFRVLPRVASKMDSIEQARRILASCWFDAGRCERLIKCLEEYRKRWDDTHGVWQTNPAKSEFNHGADAFQGLAMSDDAPANAGARIMSAIDTGGV